MRYRIQADDDDAYRRAVQCVDAHVPEMVRVKLPDRRLLAVDDLDEPTIEELRGLGVTVNPDFQWDPEGGTGIG
jgi:hypothetical protein